MQHEIKKGLIVGIVASLVFGIFGITYAAWNTDVTQGQALTHNMWNDFVEEVEGITANAGKFVSGTNTNDAIFTDGNVGIGTVSPNSKLSIVGGGITFDNLTLPSFHSAAMGRIDIHATHSHIDLHDADDSNGSYSKLERNVGSTYITSNDGTTSTVRLAVLDNGNVGIGTTAPSFMFQVGPNTPTTTSPYSYLNGLRISGGDTSNTIYQNVGDLSLGTGGGNILLKGGNLGIGTTSPRAKIEVVAGDNSVSTVLGRTSGGSFSLVTQNVTDTILYNDVFRIGTNFGNSLNDAENGYISFKRGGSGVDGYLGFGTSGIERMSIDRFGNVGVGIISPNSKLDVYGSFAGDGISLSHNGTGAKNWKITSGIGGVGHGNLGIMDGANMRFMIGSNGNIGIGTVPNSKLHVDGDARIEGDLYLGNSNGGTCNAAKRGVVIIGGDDKFYGCNGVSWKQLDN